MKKSFKITLFFWGCILLLLAKLWINLDNFALVRFSSDTQRHLLVFQELRHFEAVLSHRISTYVQYPDQLVLNDLGLTVEGGHVALTIFNKLTGLESFQLINIAAIILVILSMGAIMLLSRLFYKNQTVVPLLACAFFVSGVITFHVTPHYFAAYIFFPLLIWGLLKYLETDQKKYLLLWAIFWTFLQTLHSNYATMFLVILTAYVLGEEWKNRKNFKVRHQLHTLFLVALSIYVAHLSYYYKFVEENAESFRSFFSGYSGIWSLTYFYNPLDGLFFYGLVVAAYCYSVFHWILLHKPSRNTAPTAAHTFGMTLSQNRFLWMAWVLILALSLLVPALLEQGISAFFYGNNNLGRLENAPLLILFFLTLFTVKESFDKAHRLWVWLYMPIFVLVIGSLLLHIPFLRGLGNPLVTISFPVIDFSFPLLCIWGAHILFEKIKQFHALKRTAVMALVVMAFFSTSLNSMYGKEYQRENTDLDFIEAYQTLLPVIHEESRVGSNYAYLKSLRYLPDELIVMTKTRRELNRLNLNDEIMAKNMDYFIYYAWTVMFPEAKWLEEVRQNSKIKMIYDQNGIKIFQVMQEKNQETPAKYN